MDHRFPVGRVAAIICAVLALGLSIAAPAPARAASTVAPPSRYVPTSPAFKALPAPIRTYVTERRQGCLDTYAFMSPEERVQYFYIPADDMAGIHQAQLGGRRAIIVDNIDLCTTDVVGGNCNTRGCPTFVWLEMGPGSWRKLPDQDFPIQVDPNSHASEWLDIAPRYRHPRCIAGATEDGCGLRWKFARVPPSMKIPASLPAPGPAAGGDGAARWSYGRHPVLGLSAHVAVGNEAIGFACIQGGGGWTVSYRMTPGLVPGVKRPEISMVGIFLNPFEISGGGSFDANPAGYMEQKQSYCESPIASYRKAGSALLVDGDKLGFTAGGPRVIMEIEQNGQHFTVSKEDDIKQLARSVPIPLAGSGVAINQLIGACPALHREVNAGCDQD